MPEVNHKKLKVMFLCTGNSCRSQMAEGCARKLKGDVVEAYSAGIEKHGMNPRAIQVMAEAGVRSTRTTPRPSPNCRRWLRLRHHRLRPRERELPRVPRQERKIHVGFDDPPKLAKDAKTRRRRWATIAACAMRSAPLSRLSLSH